jgi:hypothetical protein
VAQLPVGQALAVFVFHGDGGLMALKSPQHISEGSPSLFKRAQVDDVVHFHHDVESVLQRCDQRHVAHAVPRLAFAVHEGGSLGGGHLQRRL